MLVSFIVPVYNGERYIDNCVKGILSQTLSENQYEAIFIDDGSKDSSLKRLKSLQKKNPSIIKVYSQKNKGAGEARNYAIKLAHGDYIIPVDCDDVIARDYAETLLRNARKSGADFAISGYRTVNEDMRMLTIVVPENNDFTPFKTTLTCGKIYKKSFLLQNNIRYTHAYIMEDPHFNITCAMRAHKVETIPYAGYDVIMKPKVKGQLTSSTMIRDNNPFILAMIKGFIKSDQYFAERQPVIFKYILAKFAVNNFLANKLAYKDAHEGLLGQLKYIERKGYGITLKEIIFQLKGESMATKGIISTILILRRFGLLRPFYLLYLRII